MGVNDEFTWAVDDDRYALEICDGRDRVLAAELADRFEQAPFHSLPVLAREIAKQQIGYWFQQIPVHVASVAAEPYNTLEELKEDVEKRKCLRVRHRLGGRPWGGVSEQFRAVHDWFGHFLLGAPFTLTGELEAYAKHTSMFSEMLHPALRSNVVLENAFRLARGHWHCYPKRIGGGHCSAKVVFDTVLFGEEEKWYRGFRLGF